MKTYRVRVWTGPTESRHFVAGRVNDFAGLLASPVAVGTEHIHFNIRAEDQTDAYVRVQDLFAYVGCRSYATDLGRANGVQATEITS